LAACESWVKNGLIANLVTIALDRGPVQRCNAGRAGLVAEETVDALLHEALVPTPDRGLGLAGFRHDGGRAMTVCRQQKPKPARHAFGPISGPGQSLQDADDPWT